MMNEIVAATLSLPVACDVFAKQKKVKGKAETIRTYYMFASLAAQYCIKHDLCKDTPEARTYLNRLVNELAGELEQSASHPECFTCYELYINLFNAPDMHNYTFQLSKDGQVYAYIKSINTFITFPSVLAPVLQDAINA